MDGSDPFGRATKDPCGDAAHGPAHVAAGCPPDWRRSFRLLLLRALPAGRWESALTNSGRLCVSRGSGPIPAVRDSTPWGPRDSRGVLSCFSLNCNQIMRWPQPPSHPHHRFNQPSRKFRNNAKATKPAINAPSKSLLKRHKVRSLSSRELRLVKQRSTAITRPSLSTRDLHTRTHHSTKEVPENHPVKKRNQSVDTAGSQCVYLDTLLPPFRQCFFF